ncbi:MAG: hypothetical protein K8R68_11820, partial [Bacteroidales bacterium]|nr:hypothetical protein [Bacteroidales bacterium]
TIIEDMPDQLDNLGFKDVVFYMSFINNPFDLDLDVKIKAVRGDVNNQLPIIKKITKNSSLILDRNGINNDHSTPTIVDIVNMIPEKIIMDGKVTVKGENVTFDKDDQIGVQYGIDFPLRFSTNSASYSQKDSLKIDNDMRDFLKNKCRSAGILLTVENSLPISGMLSLLVGPDSTNITTELFSIGLPTSTVFDGIVAQPGDSTFNVNLDEVKFTTIADGYFYKFIVAIDDVEEAALTANDYIIIKDVYISGKFLFDPDGE